jgi:hypothetical protein
MPFPCLLARLLLAHIRLTRLRRAGFEVRSLLNGPPLSAVVLTVSSCPHWEAGEDADENPMREPRGGHVGATSFAGGESIHGREQGERWDMQDCELLLDTYSRVYHGLHLHLTELDASIVSCKNLARLHLKVTTVATVATVAPLARGVSLSRAHARLVCNWPVLCCIPKLCAPCRLAHSRCVALGCRV